MAEDDRAVAEGSSSWGLQGGMDLHLCCNRLQLGPYAESGDSNGVRLRSQCVRGPEKRFPRCQRMPSKLFSELHNRGAWRESKSHHPFFRSLLGCADGPTFV